MKWGYILPVFLMGAIPFAAQAQNAEAAQPACDVAVWTTANYSADRMGLITGGVIDTALKRASVPEINSVDAIRMMLPPETLFEVISTSSLDDIIGRPINYIHIEKTGVESEADRKSKTRAYPSDTPCYIEVHLWNVYYQSAPFHGERIFSYWRLKDFRGEQLVSKGGYDNGQMKKFSKQDFETASEMARGAIREVFEKVATKKLPRR